MTLGGGGGGVMCVCIFVYVCVLWGVGWVGGGGATHNQRLALTIICMHRTGTTTNTKTKPKHIQQQLASKPQQPYVHSTTTHQNSTTIKNNLPSQKPKHLYNNITYRESRVLRDAHPADVRALRADARIVPVCLFFVVVVFFKLLFVCFVFFCLCCVLAV
jgi:hypothetical protein